MIRANRILMTPAERKRAELKDLKDMIDLALDIRNESLFMLLTDQLKEYEV